MTQADFYRFLTEVLRILVCALATSVIALTITRAAVFRPMRLWVKSKSAFLGELVKCTYCTSHWVSLATVLVFRPRPVESGLLILDLAISVFAVVGLAAFFAFLIYKIYAAMPPAE